MSLKEAISAAYEAALSELSELSRAEKNAALHEVAYRLYRSCEPERSEATAVLIYDPIESRR